MKSTFITLALLTMMLFKANAQGLSTTAADYERQIVSLYVQKDMKTLDRLLSSYYNSGLYPEDVLMYNYNELQGMQDWGVIIMSSAESLIGKLILQRVLNVHRDKVLICTELGDLDSLTCDRLGIPMLPHTWKPEEAYEQTIRWVAAHSDRNVYFPYTDSPLFKQFPDTMKECIYNEQQDKRLYRKFTPGMLALNYSAIYMDMLPYYREHRPDKVEWLLGLYGACQSHFNRLSMNSIFNIEQ